MHFTAPDSHFVAVNSSVSAVFPQASQVPSTVQVNSQEQEAEEPETEHLLEQGEVTSQYLRFPSGSEQYAVIVKVSPMFLVRASAN